MAPTLSLPSGSGCTITAMRLSLSLSWVSQSSRRRCILTIEQAVSSSRMLRKARTARRSNRGAAPCRASVQLIDRLRNLPRDAHEEQRVERLHHVIIRPENQAVVPRELIFHARQHHHPNVARGRI